MAYMGITLRSVQVFKTPGPGYPIDPQLSEFTLTGVEGGAADAAVFGGSFYVIFLATNGAGIPQDAPVSTGPDFTREISQVSGANLAPQYLWTDPPLTVYLPKNGDEKYTGGDFNVTISIGSKVNSYTAIALRYTGVDGYEDAHSNNNDYLGESGYIQTSHFDSTSTISNSLHLQGNSGLHSISDASEEQWNEVEAATSGSATWRSWLQVRSFAVVTPRHVNFTGIGGGDWRAIGGVVINETGSSSSSSTSSRSSSSSSRSSSSSSSSSRSSSSSSSRSSSQSSSSSSYPGAQVILGENSNADYTGVTADSQIAASVPDNNNGATVNQTIGVTNLPLTSIANCLIKFDLSDLASLIGSGAEINEAVLHMFKVVGENEPFDIDIYGMLKKYDAGTTNTPADPGEVTWNSQYHDQNPAWDTVGADGAGVDRDATSTDTVTINAPDGVWYEWDVTNLVRDQFDATSYLGFILKTDGLAKEWGAFASSDNATAANRPYLEVNLALSSSSSSSSSSRSSSSSSISSSSSSSSSRSSSSSSSRSSSSSSSRSSSSSSSSSGIPIVEYEWGENAISDFKNTTSDAPIRDLFPDNNFGVTNGVTINNPVGEEQRLLIKWDISALDGIIFNPDQIEEAYIRLYCYSWNPGVNNPNIQVFKVLKDWNEGVKQNGPANNGEVTWNSAEHNEVSWDVAGCDGTDDRTLTHETTETISDIGYYNLPVTDAIKEFYTDGTNNGFILLLNPSQHDPFARFRLSEYFDDSKRPVLRMSLRGDSSSSSSSLSSSSSSESSSSRSSSSSSQSSSSSSESSTIDGTATWGDNTGNTYIGTTTDVYIRKEFSDDTFDCPVLLASKYGAASTFLARSLIKFDLSALDELVLGASDIKQAFLYTTVVDNDATAQVDIDIFRMNRSWDSTADCGVTAYGSATWTSAKRSIDSWETAGADGVTDRQQELTDQAAVTGLDVLSFDVTDDVQEFFSSGNNEGWILINTDEENISVFGLGSAEGADGTRPYLEILYEATWTSSSSSSRSSSSSSSLSSSSSSSSRSSSSSSSSRSSSSSSSSSSRSSSSSSSSSSSLSSSSSSTTPWRYPDSLDADIGKINSGVFDNVHHEDASLLILDEVNNTPGFRYDFHWVDIPDSSSGISYVLDITGQYSGSSDHNVKLQLWNFDTTSFDYVTNNTQDIPFSLVQRSYTFVLPTASGSYIQNGNMELRIRHESAGNDGHLLRIDYMKIIEGSSSSSSSSLSSSSSSSSSRSSSSASFSSSSRSLGFE